MFGYADELQYEIKGLHEKIENLIKQHKSAKEEVWEFINNLQAIGETILTEEEIADLNNTIEKYNLEYHLRSVFISELENLLF